MRKVRHRANKAMSRPAMCSIALLIAGTILGGQNQLGAQRPELPNPTKTLIQDATRGLAPKARMKVPAALFVAARKAVASGTELERREAVTLLAFSGTEEDRTTLYQLSNGADKELSHRALVALGISGDPAGYGYLSTILNDRKQSSERRTFAALALGFETPIATENATDRGTLLAQHAQLLLNGNTKEFGAELVACFFGMSSDSNGALFKNYLGQAGGSISLPDGRKMNVLTGGDSDRFVKPLAFGGLARRFSSQEEWGYLRPGLNGTRTEERRRYEILWGLRDNPRDRFDPKLLSRIARSLERRVERDSADENRATALLALPLYDKKSGIKRARSIAISKSQGNQVRSAAFLVLGTFGEEKDVSIFERAWLQKLTPEAKAGWNLAYPRLQIKLGTPGLPMDKAGTTMELPQPVVRLREQIGLPEGTRPGVAEISAALSLTMLSDRAAAPSILRLLKAAHDPYAIRILSRCLLHLAPEMVEVKVEEFESADPGKWPWDKLMILGDWGHSLLGPILEQTIAAKNLTPEMRATLFRLTTRATLGPGYRVDEQIRSRLGLSSLPQAFEEAMAWQLRPTSPLAPSPASGR